MRHQYGISSAESQATVKSVFSLLYFAFGWDNSAPFRRKIMTLLSRSPQIVLLFAGFVNLCHGSLHFLRGRPRGGMLPAPSADAIHVKDLSQDQWFTQRLDHFDDFITKTWQQRYFYNDKFFRKPNGPVFLSIGGEGEANPIWLTVGDMMKNAQVFGAFTFLLEHRFYGKSHPTRYFKLS